MLHYAIYSMVENHCKDFISFADHSHFELVIEQLKQVAAQEEQNSKRENSVGLTGVEEEMEEVTLETNVCLLDLSYFSLLRCTTILLRNGHVSVHPDVYSGSTIFSSQDVRADFLSEAYLFHILKKMLHGISTRLVKWFWTI